MSVCESVANPFTFRLYPFICLSPSSGAIVFFVRSPSSVASCPFSFASGHAFSLSPLTFDLPFLTLRHFNKFSIWRLRSAILTGLPSTKSALFSRAAASGSFPNPVIAITGMDGIFSLSAVTTPTPLT